MKRFLTLLTFLIIFSSECLANKPIVMGTISDSHRPNKRYWVGASGQNWTGTPGSNWSYTSGGTGGAPLPTVNDDVFFDANSGNSTVLINTGGVARARNFDSTGFAGGFGGSQGMTVAGSFKMYSGTWSGAVTLTSILPGNVIDTNGLNASFGLTFNGLGGTWTLQNDFTSSRTNAIDLSAGTFNDNGKAINIPSTRRNGSAVAAIIKSGAWTLTGANDFVDWFGGIGTFTLTDTGSMKFTNNSATNKNFNVNGKTVNNIWNATQGTGFVTLFGSSFYNQVKIDAGRTTKFENGKTHTIQDLVAIGTAGNLITLTSASAAQATITSPNNINTDYCTISNINFVGTGGAVWHAGANSVDGGGNTGILFP